MVRWHSLTYICWASYNLWYFWVQFGEVDIDSSLVANHSSSNEDIIMVNNGCLCCTVRGDLVKMLLELVKKKRDKFDHIVIETTGMSTLWILVECKLIHVLRRGKDNLVAEKSCLLVFSNFFLPFFVLSLEQSSLCF